MVDLKGLVELMVKSLVDYPEDVQVTETAGEQTINFDLRVNKSDVGKVIGKDGRTAKSMRTILKAASTKINKRSNLDILE